MNVLLRTECDQRKVGERRKHTAGREPERYIARFSCGEVVVYQHLICPSMPTGMTGAEQAERGEGRKARESGTDLDEVEDTIGDAVCREALNMVQVSKRVKLPTPL